MGSFAGLTGLATREFGFVRAILPRLEPTPTANFAVLGSFARFLSG